MRPPAFWQDPDAGAAALLLSPLGWVTGRITRRRLSRPAWRAPVPVICCGNLSVGGAGKTTLALDLLTRLRARGVRVHALTRGYGGTARELLRVDAATHDATLVGDEALLLAASAPTWVAADRAAAARAAVAQGAQCLVLDDGRQHPGLAHDATLLVIDGAIGFGNGRLLPAGPLRESVEHGAARAHAAILIGPDLRAARARLPPRLPVLRAELVMAAQAHALRGRRLAAFAGIGRPEKFFGALEAIGLQLVQRAGFPDHHRYGAAELDRLAARAQAANATLVTTPKDAVRLPPAFRTQVTVLSVGLCWHDTREIDSLLERVLATSARDEVKRLKSQD